MFAVHRSSVSLLAAGVLLAALPRLAGADTCPSSMGDLNGDGLVNVVDAQCGISTALWWIQGAAHAPPSCLGEQLWRADVNCDGAVDIADVLTVIRVSVGQGLGPIDSNGNGCVDACEAPTCGDGLCDPGETCDDCPSDCGACPPTVEFASTGSRTMHASLIAGQDLRVVYDWARLPMCQKEFHGTPSWTGLIGYRFSPKGAAQYVEGTFAPPGTGEQIALQPTIAIPPGALDVWLWAEVHDEDGCMQADLNVGEGYRFPVFSAGILSQPIGAVEDVQFVTQDGLAFHFLGDQDPAWSIGHWFSQGKASWVQAAVYVAGVTDRSYPNAATAAAVAATAVQARAVFSPYGAAPPGWQATSLEYLTTLDSRFVYRWAPGLMALDGLPPGAYSYTLAFSTAFGPTSHLGTVEGGPRTMLIGLDADCDVFTPFAPPALCGG